MMRIGFLAAMICGMLACPGGLGAAPKCQSGDSALGMMLSGDEFSWQSLPDAETLDYNKARNITLVRVPTAWEKVQPVPFGPLDAKQLDRLRSYLRLASAKGIRSIIDIQNYARFNPQWARQAAAGVPLRAGYGEPQLVLGSADLPVAAFVDLWAKLAEALKGLPGVAGYDLMNEPHDLKDLHVWPAAAQGAIDAIRKVDRDVPILVEGNNYSTSVYWKIVNPEFPLSDPSNKLVYSAHAYFDDDHSGTYKLPYDKYKGVARGDGVDVVAPFVSWVRANRLKGNIGEFGVPAANDVRWLAVLDRVLAHLRQNDISGTLFYMSYDNMPGKKNPAYVRQHYGNDPTLGVPGSCSLNPGADGREAIQWSVIRKYTKTNGDAACWNR